MEQTFVFARGAREGQVAARALVKGALYDRKARRYVPVRDMMDAIGVTAASPPPPADLDAFLAADRALREVDRKR
jgi:hypothetical protein